MNDRELEIRDYDVLEESLKKDPYHVGTEVEDFLQTNVLSRIVEDERGPVAAYRLSKALRLDTQFFDNKDVKRNLPAILLGMANVIEAAVLNGFSEVIFDTDNPLLKRFMEKRLGFTESSGHTMRKVL